MISLHRRSLHKVLIPLLRKYSSLKSLEVGSGNKETSYSKRYMKNSATLDVIFGADVKASVYSIPFPKNYFDMVFCVEAFYSFENPVLAIKEMARVLKKGGVLIFTSEFVFPKLSDESLFGLYSETALKKMLCSAGLVKTELLPVTGFFGTVGNLIDRKISFFGKFRHLFFPLLVISMLLYVLDFKKDSKFTTSFVIVARK